MDRGISLFESLKLTPLSHHTDCKNKDNSYLLQEYDYLLTPLTEGEDWKSRECRLLEIKKVVILIKCSEKKSITIGLSEDYIASTKQYQVLCTLADV